jgi:hypothetical protein
VTYGEAVGNGHRGTLREGVGAPEHSAYYPPLHFSPAPAADLPTGWVVSVLIPGQVLANWGYVLCWWGVLGTPVPALYLELSPRVQAGQRPHTLSKTVAGDTDTGCLGPTTSSPQVSLAPYWAGGSTHGTTTVGQGGRRPPRGPR